MFVMSYRTLHRSQSDSKLPIARPKRATRRWCVTVVGNLAFFLRRTSRGAGCRAWRKKNAPRSLIWHLESEAKNRKPDKSAQVKPFWFSGCWWALAKGTAWAGFCLGILLLLDRAAGRPRRPSRGGAVAPPPHRRRPQRRRRGGLQGTFQARASREYPRRRRPLCRARRGPPPQSQPSFPAQAIRAPSRTARRTRACI